jgi:phosphoribosylanthranilate isomerase
MSAEPVVSRSTRTRIKICCIRSWAEADLAIARGADALGFVAAMPSGAGPIADDLIAEIVERVPPPLATFLLTREIDAYAIVAHARRTHPSTIQLVDEQAVTAHDAIRLALPGIRIVQVIHIEDEGAVERAVTASATADALLLDSGRPSLAVPELGGTGRVHDWTISRRIVDAVAVPVFLAGGLDPDNVADAIEQVRPFGLDLCSGIRTEGALDAALLARFVAAVARADGPSVAVTR